MHVVCVELDQRSKFGELQKIFSRKRITSGPLLAARLSVISAVAAPCFLKAQQPTRMFEPVQIYAKLAAYALATPSDARRKMPPTSRKKTGVQNVDIGGAYKLGKVGPLESSNA